MSEGLPPGPLLAYYGDDFTGSAAVMEVMSFAGLDSVMFLRPPSPAASGRLRRQALHRHRRHRALEAAGLDGRTPAADLRGAGRHRRAADPLQGLLDLRFRARHRLDRPGDRPRRRDVRSHLRAARRRGARHRPLPALRQSLRGRRRHGPQARPPPGHGPPSRDANGRGRSRPPSRAPDRAADRPDRPSHPTDEQGAGRVGQPAGFRGAHPRDRRRRRTEPCRGRRADLGEPGDLPLRRRLAGHRIRARRPLAAGRPDPARAASDASGAGRAHRRRLRLLLARHGSQIAHAQRHGFAAIRLNAARAVDPAAWEAECGRAVAIALDALGQGASPLVFTAEGPDDPAVAALMEACRSAGSDMAEVNDRIGAGLGAILAAILDTSGLGRALIAGGDTSGQATLALGVDALSVIAEIAPGSPLCRAHADDTRRDGLELALKGGQIGGVDYFSAVRAGGPIAPR